jgi:hypothetical protein
MLRRRRPAANPPIDVRRPSVPPRLEMEQRVGDCPRQSGTVPGFPLADYTRRSRPGDDPCGPTASARRRLSRSTSTPRRSGSARIRPTPNGPARSPRARTGPRWRCRRSSRSCAGTTSRPRSSSPGGWRSSTATGCARSSRTGTRSATTGTRTPRPPTWTRPPRRTSSSARSRSCAASAPIPSATARRHGTSARPRSSCSRSTDSSTPPT